jgi:hypothetical protein
LSRAPSLAAIGSRSRIEISLLGAQSYAAA